MASGGWHHTPNRRKICEKIGKCNQYDFLQVLSKSSWTSFKSIFEILSPAGSVTWSLLEGWYTRDQWFSKFLRICRQVFDISELQGDNFRNQKSRATIYGKTDQSKIWPKAQRRSCLANLGAWRPSPCKVVTQSPWFRQLEALFTYVICWKN